MCGQLAAESCTPIIAEITVTKQEEGSGQVEWFHCSLSSFVLCTLYSSLAGPMPGEPRRKSKVDMEILEVVDIQLATSCHARLQYANTAEKRSNRLVNTSK